MNKLSADITQKFFPGLVLHSHHVPGDGSCFYHSVAFALFPGKNRGRSLRDKIKDHLVKKGKKGWDDFWNKLPSFIKHISFETAVQRVEDPTTWAETSMIVYTMTKLKLNFMFIDEEKNEVYCRIASFSRKGRPLVLILWQNYSHFVPIVQVNDYGGFGQGFASAHCYGGEVYNAVKQAYGTSPCGRLQGGMEEREKRNRKRKRKRQKTDRYVPEADVLAKLRDILGVADETTLQRIKEIFQLNRMSNGKVLDFLKRKEQTVRDRMLPTATLPPYREGAAADPYKFVRYDKREMDKEAKHAGEFKIAHYTRREFKNFATLHFDVLEGDDRDRADPERLLLQSVCDMNVVGRYVKNFALGSSEFLVATEGGRVMGVLVYEGSDERWYNARLLCSLEQKKGTGERLLMDLLRRHFEAFDGEGGVKVFSTSPAVGFYRKMGFTGVENRFSYVHERFEAHAFESFEPKAALGKACKGWRGELNGAQLLVARHGRTVSAFFAYDVDGRDYVVRTFCEHRKAPIGTLAHITKRLQRDHFLAFNGQGAIRIPAAVARKEFKAEYFKETKDDGLEFRPMYRIW